MKGLDLFIDSSVSTSRII